MTIEQTQCDQCGKIHDFRKKTVQLREVSGMSVRQIDREAETPSWDLANRHQGSKIFTLSFYDFCDLACLKAWIEQQPAVPPVIESLSQCKEIAKD